MNFRCPLSREVVFSPYLMSIMRRGGKETGSLRQRIHTLLQSRPAGLAAISRPVASESPVKQRRSPPQDPETAASPYEEIEEPSPKPRSFKHRLAGQSCELTTKQVQLRLSSDGKEILQSSPKHVSVSLLDSFISSVQSSDQDVESTVRRLWPTARLVQKPVPKRPPKTVLCVQGDHCTFYELL